MVPKPLWEAAPWEGHSVGFWANELGNLAAEIHLLQEVCEHLGKGPSAHKKLQLIIYKLGQGGATPASAGTGTRTY